MAPCRSRRPASSRSRPRPGSSSPPRPGPLTRIARLKRSTPAINRRLRPRRPRTRARTSPSRRSRPIAREIAFGSGGDLWSAPLAGGDARLLVVACRERIAPELLARRQDAGVRLRSHRRRRHLPADARDRRPAPADVRRRQRAPRRLVARRTVDLLLVELARDRRQRHLSRPRVRRHADAGERRSLHERVRRRAVAGRASRSRSARAATAPASGGARATRTSMNPRSG